MSPQYIHLTAAIVIFITTVATIAQIILIDLRHNRMGKAKRANLIVWMVLSGAIFNSPFIYQAVIGLNTL